MIATAISAPLRGLLEAFGSDVRKAKISPGVPYWDTARDELVRNLRTHAAVLTSLGRPRRLNTMYGKTSADRLSLAWAYGCAKYPAQGLQELAATYWAEIQSPAWRFVAVANLSDFDCDREDIEFPNGLRIRTRSRPELTVITGYSLDELAATLGEDWLKGSGSAGRFVVIHTESEPKHPGNIVQSNTGREASRIANLITALRLHAAGDVSMSTLFITRIEPFPIGLGGISRMGRLGGGGPFGSPYHLRAAESEKVALLMKQLEELQDSKSALRGRIERALVRFSSAYDRLWNGSDRVIDDMIALEALVGTAGPELSTSLALRVSGLIAQDDGERVRIYDRVRSFYSTRSVLVHGSPLKARNVEDVNAEAELRDLLRRLIRGFLNLLLSTAYASSSLVEGLDRLLLDQKRRADIQRDMAVGEASHADTQQGQTVPQWTDQPSSSVQVQTYPGSD